MNEMTNDLLLGLNPQQQLAVTHTGGPLLILAGAGSGKTRALTYRAAYLIREKGVAPDAILLTTFTNKAAGEMQERLYELVGYKLPFAGTFHSLCARLLRRHAAEVGLDNNFVIYDAKDQIEAIKSVMESLRIDPKEFKPGAILNAIESAKNELITPTKYKGFVRGKFQEAAAAVYKSYQKALKEYNALDFSDLLFETVKLLTVQQQLRQRYNEQFLHVLVDEYQDTNKAQYQLTKLLTGHHQNVCVVGDASQAIYSWRGADYRNLQLLKQDFPTLTTIRLEQNYRSTQNILQAAYAVIRNNESHPILELWTDSHPGDLIQLVEAEDEYVEIAQALSGVDKLKPEKFSEVAILYRTNAQSRVVEELCIRKGYPYVLVGGVKFYDRKEVKDVISYIRYLYNPADEVSLRRITKLGKRRLANLMDWREKVNLDDLSPLEVLDGILESTGYLSKFDPKKPDDLARIENVQELRNLAGTFSDLGVMLENIALVEQDTSGKGLVTSKSVIGTSETPNALVLMTLHASKGLEFDHVFMIGMEEGLFPHSRTIYDKSELEEERRLCYVGITRARKTVCLSHAKRRFYFGSPTQNRVSRFVDEIPKELIEAKSAGGNSVKRVRKPIDDSLFDAFMDGEIDIDAFLEG